jgi:hypothetical protein
MYQQTGTAGGPTGAGEAPKEEKVEEADFEIVDDDKSKN